MRTRLLHWLVPALVYATFFVWYTDLSGPLSETETNQILAAMVNTGYEQDAVAMIERFAREDTGRQILMINSLDFNESPPNVEGAEPGESGMQLMGRYMQHMLPAMLRNACHPVLAGPVTSQAIDVVGIENAEHWDQGAVVRYRSRRTLLKIISNPAFAGNHEFKTAGLTKTVAYPIEPSLYLGDLRLILGLVLLTLTAIIDSWRFSRNPAN